MWRSGFPEGVRAGRSACTRSSIPRSRDLISARTDTVVRNVVLDARRARGVVCSSDGTAEPLRSEREVILSQRIPFSLLMPSCVGPADHLHEHAIAVVHELPRVDRNVRDHLDVHIQRQADPRHTRNRYVGPLARVVVSAQWVLTGRGGVWASTPVEVGAFTRRSSQATHPDIQYHFFPFLLERSRPSHSESGFYVRVGTLREGSRCTLRIAGADPTAPPLIDFNYIDDPASGGPGLVRHRPVRERRRLVLRTVPDGLRIDSDRHRVAHPQSQSTNSCPGTSTRRQDESQGGALAYEARPSSQSALTARRRSRSQPKVSRRASPPHTTLPSVTTLRRTRRGTKRG